MHLCNEKGRLPKKYYQENADQLKAARAQYQAEPEKKRVTLEAALAATQVLLDTGL